MRNLSRNSDFRELNGKKLVKTNNTLLYLVEWHGMSRNIFRQFDNVLGKKKRLGYQPEA